MADNKNLRISCRIPCEITYSRRRATATVVDLSERGLGIETTIEIGEGDAVRIRLYPNRATGSIEVQGIIWNERTQMKSRGHPGSRESKILGLMLSETPNTYLALIEKLGSHDHARPSAARRSTSRAEIVDKKAPTDRPDGDALQILKESPADPALPRPRSPLPPPKMSEEESLPLFRLRIKQTDGPRTRRVEIRARSSNDAASRVPLLVDGNWEILEIKRITS